MARWDAILTLPVQNPPTLEFSSTDIVWSRVEGWKEMMDRVALIPFTRVNDFVRGESNRKECPTKFHVEARRRRPPDMPYKPKVDGILEYILYWCSFGPDDHRKGGVVRPSRNYSAKRKTPAGRPNTKRGCTCHFIVKRLIAEPTVALIIYNHEKHIDKQGSPCHGPLDTKAVGTRAMFAPYISEELRLQVMSLLYVGVPVETIMQRHTETVDKQGGPRNRDDLLTHRYVRRLERKIRRSTYELDVDDAVSLDMWIETHQAHVFFYEDYSDSEPFVLGIQTEWQLQQMIRFGNRNLVASDSSFGTNKLKYPIHSLLVFDSNNSAIPIAWIITPRFACRESHRWLRSLYDRVHSKDPNWKLGGFIIDDPLADVHTIREVFQCSVLFCHWRMRRAWQKNIMERCLDEEMRAEIFRQLGNVVSSICRGGGDVDLFEGFLEDFVDSLGFLDYFKGTWFPRLVPWAAALKTLPVATTETCAAIECYHHQLKLRLLNEKDPSVYQRADWLVDKLGTKVHSYYWLDEFTGKASFARYWKDEWKSDLTPWQQALQIPDSNVTTDGPCVRVKCQIDQHIAYTVWNAGSEFALCDCSWSRIGNLCKHVIKAGTLLRGRGLAAPSTSLVKYNQILSSILNCPPHDSLIRDHAVALATHVKMQLNALYDPEGRGAVPSVSTHEDHPGQRPPASVEMDVADRQPPPASPLEQPFKDGSDSLRDGNPCLDTNSSTDSVMGKNSQENLNAACGAPANPSGSTDGVREGELDSVHLQPAGSKSASNGAAHVSEPQISKILDDGNKFSDVRGLASDPMDDDSTEKDFEACCATANQPENSKNSSENIVIKRQSSDLMMNGVLTKNGVLKADIKRPDQGRPSKRALVGQATHDCITDDAVANGHLISNSTPDIENMAVDPPEELSTSTMLPAATGQRTELDTTEEAGKDAGVVMDVEISPSAEPATK
ncbi:unnamed protein product [Spirodela intermedia]|uniref:SWIM-type domain-containing protein n=1 Tax=Spirodela intermedia TaxID=51605 RepID=A0A7I8K0R3_SPIIN|nr:unnamed protein product [Spirodela intermedia]